MAEPVKDLAAATAVLASALNSYIGACSAAHDFCKNNYPPNEIPDTLVNRLNQEDSAFEFYKHRLGTAKAIVNRAKNYYLSHFTINSLPSEILIRIFHLVVGPRPCEAQEHDDEEIQLPRYPDYLSHVCSRWRDLALKTPTLWTHIDYVTYHPLSPVFHERAYDLAERSEFLPLHLHIYEPDSLQRYNYDHLLEFLTATSFAVRSLEFVLSEASDIFSGEHADILATHFRNCVPKLFDELVVVSPGDTSPMLLTPAFDVDEVEDGLWLEIDEVFEQMLPLKILRLDGVYFPWANPIYHNLVELRITSPRAATITKMELYDILKSNPALQILHFGHEVVESTGSTAQAVIMAPVLLSELQVLNLAAVEQDEIGVFTSLLAPSPRVLQFTIELDSRSLPPYDGEVLKFVSSSNITKLQVIARGEMEEQNDITLVDTLLHPAPRVQELVLDGFDWPRECDAMLERCECSAKLDGPRLEALYILNGSTSINTLLRLATRHPTKKMVLWDCVVWGVGYDGLPRSETESVLSKICGDVSIVEGGQSPVEYWDW